MMENILERSSGTLLMPGMPRARGELVMNETRAAFVNKKGQELAAFEFSQLERLLNVRHGGVSSTVTVSLKDGSAFEMYLDKGLAAYAFLDAHWLSKPRQVRSRADELRRLAELRGERIQKVRTISDSRRRAFRICALVVALAVGSKLYAAQTGQFRWNLWECLGERLDVALRGGQVVQMDVPCGLLLPVGQPPVGVEVQLVSGSCYLQV